MRPSSPVRRRRRGGRRVHRDRLLGRLGGRRIHLGGSALAVVLAHGDRTARRGARPGRTGGEGAGGAGLGSVPAGAWDLLVACNGADGWSFRVESGPDGGDTLARSDVPCGATERLSVTVPESGGLTVRAHRSGTAPEAVRRGDVPSTGTSRSCRRGSSRSRGPTSWADRRTRRDEGSGRPSQTGHAAKKPLPAVGPTRRTTRSTRLVAPVLVFVVRSSSTSSGFRVPSSCVVSATTAR